MKVNGVDISYCQQGLDYAKLKAAGIKFAVIRAGVSTRPDNLLDTHVKGCIANGIAYGFYWYCMATSVDGVKAEAAACLEAISKYSRPQYPVFFDMEEQSQINNLDTKTRTDMALAFCTIMENGGYPCGVYANPAWLENYYDKSRIMGKHDIWLAHWTGNPDYSSKYNYGQTMWQWGLDGMNIDGNIAFIDYPAKTTCWYKVYDTMQNNVAPTQSDLSAIALAVIRGEYGNGKERVQKLNAAGYNYEEVQAKVNELLVQKGN